MISSQNPGVELADNFTDFVRINQDILREKINDEYFVEKFFTVSDQGICLSHYLFKFYVYSKDCLTWAGCPASLCNKNVQMHLRIAHERKNRFRILNPTLITLTPPCGTPTYSYIILGQLLVLALGYDTTWYRPKHSNSLNLF